MAISYQKRPIMTLDPTDIQLNDRMDGSKVNTEEDHDLYVACDDSVMFPVLS